MYVLLVTILYIVMIDIITLSTAEPVLLGQRRRSSFRGGGGAIVWGEIFHNAHVFLYGKFGGVPTNVVSLFGLVIFHNHTVFVF